MNILVIRLSSIGDIIMTTPVLEALRKRFPEAAIDYLVMDRFQDAIEGNPHVNRIIPFAKELHPGLTGLKRFCDALKPNRYDLIIDLHAKLRSLVICRLLGTPRILRYHKRSWWKGVLVHMHLMRYHASDTIVRNYFRPLRKIGVEYQGESLRFDTTADIGPEFEHLKDFVVFAPGAAHANKCWPKEYFVELGRRLERTVVLIGSREEKSVFEEIKEAIGPSCVNLAGRMSLKQNGTVIARSSFVVTNDSAPFHMARGLGKKVFVLFGPTDPGMFDFDDNAIPLSIVPACAPCSLYGGPRCPKRHFECMRGLTPEIVYQQICSNLKGHPEKKGEACE